MLVWLFCEASSVLLIGGRGNVDLTQAADRFAREEAVPVEPQELAERVVATLCLAFLPFVRLDQNHLVAAVVSQHADQLIVETAEFQDGDERFVAVQPLAGELLKEGVDLRGLL